MSIREKLEFVSQKEKCRELIGNFKKSIELWFLAGEADDELTFEEIKKSCLEIILHGLNEFDDGGSQKVCVESSRIFHLFFVYG